MEHVNDLKRGLKDIACETDDAMPTVAVHYAGEALKQIEILEKGLIDIKNHQEFSVGGIGHRLSTTWQIANKALIEYLMPSIEEAKNGIFSDKTVQQIADEIMKKHRTK